MRFSVHWYSVTEDAYKKEPHFAPIQHYFGAWFQTKNYAEGVASILIGFNCVGWIPGMTGSVKDFETGFLLRKKYTKARRQIEVDIKLNHAAVMRTTNKAKALAVLRVAFERICQEIGTLKIPQFDTAAFQADWLAELAASDLLTKPIPRIQWQYEERPVAPLAPKPAPALPAAQFWQLISEANATAPTTPAAQCDWLIQQLATRPLCQIIGFEIQLRKLLKRLYSYDTLAVAKIVEGSVSDDSFLYFCCYLILAGPLVFRQVLQQPDAIAAELAPATTSEFLSSVADRAFELQLGGQTDKLLPSERGQEIYDYNTPAIAMAGEDWEEADLPRRFPRLTANYWGNSFRT
jgi:hypothetical protein